MNNSVLLLQLIVILVTARACGWLLRYLGQPAVVGEMAAGVRLGPVCLGALFPQAHGQLFSSPSRLADCRRPATVGLVMFMFLVGLELRTHRSVRERS